MDKKAMNNLSYGLFVLTARQGDKDNGCIINTVQQVTSDPNRISITVNKANFTHDMIMETGIFTVSTISEDATFDLFKRFGFQSGRDTDKFAGFYEFETGLNDVRFITEGTNSYISGKVFKTIDLGTHTMFIADVLAINSDDKYIDDNGAFDISKCNLISYANGGYYSMGKKLGKFGFSVQKKKKTKFNIKKSKK